MRPFLGSVMVLVSPALVAATIKAMSSNGEGISGGEKQKIGIVRTLAKDAEVLIFDEPTSALDQRSRKELYTLLRQIKKDKIIIIVSHDDEITQVVDHVITVHK